MPLQGHLISVASLQLCLLIGWKVKTRSLSKNPIPQTKAHPQLVDSQVPLGFPLPRSRAGHMMLPVSLSSSHAYASSLSARLGAQNGSRHFPPAPGTRLQCSDANNKGRSHPVGLSLVGLPMVGSQFSLLGKMPPILSLVCKDSPLN